MLIIKAENLEKVVVEILKKSGSEPEEAHIVAVHLVRSNLVGHDSHGVVSLPFYIKDVSQGLLKPNMPVKLIKEEGSILIFDGQRGFGQRTAKEAMDAAIAKCKQTGLSVAALRNAHHIGRVGAYGEQSIETGVISLHFVNVTEIPPVVSPYRGREARFSTNPVCMAMPGTDNTEPVLLDMATSVISVGKAKVAMHSDKSLENEPILDADGNPTNDPTPLFSDPKGTLKTFGLYKGYGIALFCELLAGALCGGGTIQPENERPGGVTNNMLAILLDPKRFVDMDWFHNEIDALISYVKESALQDPEQPVLVAGDPERLSLKERQTKGIPLDPVTWSQIIEAGESVGLEKAILESIVR